MALKKFRTLAEWVLDVNVAMVVWKDPKRWKVFLLLRGGAGVFK